MSFMIFWEWLGLVSGRGGDGLVDWIGDGVEEVVGFESKNQTGDGQGDECPDLAAAEVCWEFVMCMVVFGFAERAKADFSDHDEEVHGGDDHACACKDCEPEAECLAPSSYLMRRGKPGIGLECTDEAKDFRWEAVEAGEAY